MTEFEKYLKRMNDFRSKTVMFASEDDTAACNDSASFDLKPAASCGRLLECCCSTR